MNPVTSLKAQAIAFGLKTVTGFDPLVSERPDGRALILFKQADLPQIRKNVEALALKAGQGTGDVSVDLKPVLAPIAIKYMLPLILGAVAIGGVAGYILAKGIR